MARFYLIMSRPGYHRTCRKAKVTHVFMHVVYLHLTHSMYTLDTGDGLSLGDADC